MKVLGLDLDNSPHIAQDKSLRYAKNITIAISIKNNTKSTGCSHICIILDKILVS